LKKIFSIKIITKNKNKNKIINKMSLNKKVIIFLAIFSVISFGSADKYSKDHINAHWNRIGRNIDGSVAGQEKLDQIKMIERLMKEIIGELLFLKLQGQSLVVIKLYISILI
jgi:hypothetical protein